MKRPVLFFSRASALLSMVFLMMVVAGCAGDDDANNDGGTDTDNDGGADGDGGTDGADWTPPIGIPEPGFGIRETAPAMPETWDAATPGIYYVDVSHAAANDADNPYGTPALPRVSMPTALTAGDVVYVAGGPYSSIAFVASGTAAAPVFVTAVDPASPPGIVGSVSIAGSYMIFERFEVTGPSSGVRIRTPSDHIAVRHNDVHGAEGGGASLYTGRWNPEDDPAMAEQIVFFDNVVHDNGDVMANFDEDHHAVALGHHAAYVWIVDNTMYLNSGDGLQVNAKKAYLMDTLHHVYAGRNVAYENKQTGLWTKQAMDVVFSENVVYGHRPSNSSGGAGIGVQYGPERVWVIFNRIYDCEMGITSSTNVGDEDGVAGTGENVYLIGNLIYDIHKESGDQPGSNPWQAGAGIHLTDQTSTKYIINNTIHDTDVAFTYARGTGPVHLANNIFTGSLGTHVRIETGAAATGSTIRDTLLDPGGALRWGDGTTHSIASFKAAFSGLCSGCIEDDPGFTDASGADFTLTSGSPALDAGAVHEVEAVFESLYGLSIAVAIDGTPRPQGDDVDLGCYEQ